MNWTETIERYIAEGRTVSGGKGAGTADSQRTAELGMQQSAFNTQQSQLAALNKAFSQYTTGAGQGFDPSQLAQMRTQFLNSNNQTFNQAGQQVRSALGARGEGTGSNPVGGLYGGNIASLLGAKAGSQSQGLLGLNVQNSMQALTNKFNAGNILSGNAATLTGTQGVAGNAASSALNSYIQGSNSGLLQSLVGGFGSGFGQGLGSGLTGGLGSAASSSGGSSGGGAGLPSCCWVATSFYGVESPQVKIIRHWLHTDSPAWFRTFYIKHGPWIAKTPLRWLFKPLFEGVLRSKGFYAQHVLFSEVG